MHELLPSAHKYAAPVWRLWDPRLHALTYSPMGALHGSLRGGSKRPKASIQLHLKPAHFWPLQAGKTLLQASSDVWDVFSNEANRLYLGSQLLPNITDTETAEECAIACIEAQPCWFWSWCPSDAEAG